MSKASLTLLGTSVTAVASTSTVALTSGSGEIGKSNEREKGNKSNQNPKPSVPEWAKELITKLTSAKDIKNKYKEIKCLKDQYSDKWESLKEDKIKQENPKFTWEDKDNNEIEGCLMVEYHEWKYPSSNKWYGDFNLIWSLKGEKQALIVSFNSKINNGKISIDAAAYALNRGDNNKWDTYYKKEDVTKDITNKDDISKWFPEPGDSLKTFTGTSYWGLDLKLENICKENDANCPQDGEVKLLAKSNSWNWIAMSGANTYKIHEWNKNFYSWFNILFPDWIDSNNKIKDFVGQWNGTQRK